MFVRLQHWPCSLSLLQAHNTIANTGFHTPAFDTSTRSEKITTLWSLNRRRLRVIHKREAPSSKYLLFAAGNSCVCVHFPALPCQSHFKSVAFQASCQVQAASFAVFTRPCIFLVAQPPSVPTSLVLFSIELNSKGGIKLSAKREPAGFEPVGLEWGGSCRLI